MHPPSPSDEEATKLVQYQQAYDATSKLINVIDDLTQAVLGIIQTTGQRKPPMIVTLSAANNEFLANLSNIKSPALLTI